MCAECAYYNMKTHKCTRGCTGEPDLKNGDDVRFFTDCPFPTVTESTNSGLTMHSAWEDCGIDGTVKCPLCQFVDFFAKRDRVMLFRYCPGCGAKMDGGTDDA